ncbi:flap endonuclease 1 [Striga asiatica]|uniref:Flap endonuclease 1 n=1 Tax=Striga asiatica TaxID=4170 RepID=A0A5A7Q3T3_STRAF|nr:flap endonuclease 1 [Striga asiatica]
MLGGQEKTESSDSWLSNSEKKPYFSMRFLSGEAGHQIFGEKKSDDPLPLFVSLSPAYCVCDQLAISGRTSASSGEDEPPAARSNPFPARADTQPRSPREPVSVRSAAATHRREVAQSEQTSSNRPFRFLSDGQRWSLFRRVAVVSGSRSHGSGSPFGPVQE